MTRWGILSTARINRLVLAGARESEDAQVVAVASRDRGRAEAYAREHGIERAHGSYDALLEDPEVDAVYISLPNGFHVDWSIRALEAGKHVLCEKPLDRRPEEVEQAFAAAERAGRVLMEAFMFRHNPQTRKLVELLPRIGRLQTIRATFAFPLVDEANVRLSSGLDGGSLMDVGCYCVSGARLLAGEPERVYGEQVTGPTGVDLRFTGTMRFADDVVAEFTSAFTLAHQSLEAIGDDGALLVPDPWHGRRGEIQLNGDAMRVEPADAYRLELENMGAAIRGEEEPLLGREDALGQARTIAALYRSASSGEAAIP